MIPVAFREGTDYDKNFVLSAWLRSLRVSRPGIFEFTPPQCTSPKRIPVDSGFFAAHMPHDLYYERFRPIIENRIYPKSNILIAYNPEDKDQIYGFAAYRHHTNVTVFSFCYVKQPFRKFGVGRQLFEIARSKTNVSTYHAPWLSKLFKKEGIVFDPFFDLEP